MRSKYSLYNIISSIVLQVVTFVSGFILPRFLIVVYGSEMNGLISSLKQFINYATLIEAGLAGAAIYMLYKPLASNDIDEISSIVTSSKKFYLRSGYFFLIIVVLLSCILSIFMDSSTIYAYQIFFLTLILGINGALEFFVMGKYRVLITASQKGYVISIVQSISIIINTVIIIVGAKLHWNILFLQLFATISYLFRAFCLAIYVKRKFPTVSYSSKKIISLEQRGDVLLHQIGGMVVFNTPVLVVSFLCGLVSASIYSVYHMILMGLINLIGIFNTSLVSIFGHIMQTDTKQDVIKKYREIEFIIYFICRNIYSIVIFVIVPFIKIYTERFEDNYFCPTLIILLVLCGIVHSLRIPQSMIINAVGHFKKTHNKTIIEAIVCVSVSILGTLVFGMQGVLLGIFVSGLYRTIDAIVYVPRHVISVSIGLTIKRICIYFLSIIFSFCIWYFVRDIVITNLYSLIGYGIFVACCIFICNLFLSFIFENGYLKSILVRVKFLIKK